ncbi:FXYD domain-containing ion transport regulator 3-like [Sphaerodactylus townsendi]|uniref:FXYD domain-containing ion transport regulator 3 n=1 Tax=Sphaerodactylus townsendi TaxID=933632 RepID=A0ACB8FSK3_9SAUR|nr:FXYD domain-containing ion transport regulator 3-like [Sphaerodactylus townsendi]
MKLTTTEILLLMLTGFPLLEANDPTDKSSPFYYDYHALRVGGMIFAGVLCFIGIAILISGKCKCKKKRSVQALVPVKSSAAGGSTEC